MIFQGPAIIETGGQQIYSKDNIVAKINVKTQGIMSESIGQTDFRDDDVDVEISATPDGQVTSDLLPILFPYFSAGWGPGMSIFGSNADVPLTIWTRDGYKFSFNNTALTKQPDFFASAIKTVYGSATWRALRSDATAASVANSLVTITKAAYPGDAGYNAGNIITSPFAARWLTGAVPGGATTATEANPSVFDQAANGLAIGDRVLNTGFANPVLNGYFTVATKPNADTFTLYIYGTTNPLANAVAADAGTVTRANSFDSFSTEAGFTVASALKLTDVSDDDGGVSDLRLDNDWLTTQAKCVPVGPSPGEIEAALGFQGGTAGRGQSRNSIGRHLYLSGNGIYLKMINAFMTDSQFVRAGAKVKRVGETTFMSTPSVVAGTLTGPAVLSTEVIA
jgi:hypothetical protein